MKTMGLCPAENIARTMTRLYDNRLTTTSGGNLSIMDDEGNLWISPSGVDKAHLTADDIMKVMPDGEIVGKHRPSTEYPFHRAILRSRPDLHAVLQAHPAGLVAYILERRLPELNMMPGVSELCGKIAIAKYALPGSSRLGEYISSEFAKGCDTVLLENHGVVLGAESLEKAYMMFEALDFAARTGVAAAMLKRDARVLGAAELELKAKPVLLPDTLEGEAPEGDDALRDSVIAMTKRCYKNTLFTAATGVFAAKEADGSFVITPDGEDRGMLTSDMLVRVRDGRCEEGKTASRYAWLAERIFAAHGDIKSLAFARCPYAMGFAVTGAEFNSHLIPEGYICLRNVARFPFGTIENSPESIVSAISMKTPIIFIENDLIIVAGTDTLNAYDRLEVLEFGAQSLCCIETMNGKIVPISDAEIHEIEVAFGL